MAQPSIKDFFSSNRPKLDDKEDPSASTETSPSVQNIEQPCSSSSTGINEDQDLSQLAFDDLDIGLHLDSSKRSSSVTFSLLQSEWRPDHKYKFPKSKRNLSFQINWFTQFEWLSYSAALSGAFCKYCALFGTEAARGKFGSQELLKFVKSPFSNWIKALEEFRNHQKSEHHKKCVLMAENFIQVYKNPESSIALQLDSYKVAKIKENRQKLVPIIESILFCGRQEIALRGHRDDGPMSLEEPNENDGNFRSLLRMRANSGDLKLKEHILAGPSNATYISKTTQNELIDCIGELFQTSLVANINKAKCFAVLADETTDISGTEQLTLCVRYLNEHLKLQEDFLGFVPLNSMTAENISDIIIGTLKELKVNVQYLRGQGYDGASTMKGHISGVQTRIRKMYPQAIYVHCSSHVLNLVLSESCKVQDIQNTLGTLGKILTFLNTPKRLNVLSSTIKLKAPESQKTKLIQYCATRFVQRHDAIFRFTELVDFVVESLEEIEETFDSDSATTAFNLRCSMIRLEFLVSMFTADAILSLTVSLSKFLQGEGNDLAQAVDSIEDVEATLNYMRSNCDGEFNVVWSKVEKIAKVQEIEIKIPRRPSRSKNRSNVEAQNPEEYFRRSIFIPFLDHVLLQLKTRFSDHKELIQQFQALIPRSIKTNSSIDALLEFYESDIISPKSVVLSEFKLWIRKWEKASESERPGSPIDSILVCNPDFFPNIFNLLKIYATLPVSTCTPERTFSSLKRLKTYLRNTTGETRLNGLALMAAHREIKVDAGQVIDLFATKKNRKLQLDL